MFGNALRFENLHQKYLDADDRVSTEILLSNASAVTTVWTTHAPLEHEPRLINDLYRVGMRS
jgi:hypothetical protein